MQFDAKRLSILAGIGSTDQAVLSEGADTALEEEKSGSWKKGEKSKTHSGEDDTWKAGEESKTDKGTHDRGERAGDEEGSELEEADIDYSGHGMRTGDESDTELGHEDFEEVVDPMDEDDSVHVDEPGWGQKKWDSGLEENTVYEIDESMLRRELQSIRRERQQALAESKIRSVIRHEIGNIFQQLSHEDLNLGASWVYGKENKPRNSKAGQLWVGSPSIGFKK